jgi:putative endonuclease
MARQAAGHQRAARLPGATPVPNPRHELGQQAEDAAARWLTAMSWQVLDRRWRTPAGELDLVCRDPSGALVAVEVKLRRTARAGSALEAIDRRRLLRLRAALAAYARASVAHGSPPGWTSLRLDLVTAEPAAGGWRLRRHAGVDAW